MPLVGYVIVYRELVAGESVTCSAAPEIVNEYVLVMLGNWPLQKFSVEPLAQGPLSVGPLIDAETVVLKLVVNAPTEATDCDHEPATAVFKATVMVQLPPGATPLQVLPVNENGEANPLRPLRVIGALPPLLTATDNVGEPELNVREPKARLFAAGTTMRDDPPWLKNLDA